MESVSRILEKPLLKKCLQLTSVVVAEEPVALLRPKRQGPV